MTRSADQTVLVTGGNNGVGRGIATRFAQEGAQVMGLTLDVTDAGAVRTSHSEVETHEWLDVRAYLDRAI